MAFDVAIVGAGVVGLTAALSMSERGFRVALIDKRSHAQMKRDSQRVYALNEASLSLFQQLKLQDTLPEESLTPYTRMHVWVAHSQAHIDFDARLIGQARLGAILPETPLVETLYAMCMNTPFITFLPETHIETIQTYPSHIELIHGNESHQAQLLMIADGPLSPLRAHLAIPTTQWSYNQTALVATVKTELPHAYSCYQIFTPEGPLAFLPLNDPHQCSIVWSTAPAFAQSLLNLPEAKFNEALATHFQHRLGGVQRLSPLSHFPLTMRHVKQYVSTRWLILGDAAHTIHPMAGLGLNVGLADLSCWLRQIDQYQFIRLTRALQAYQRERKTEVWKTVLMMDGLKMLFGHPVSPIQQLRDCGLKACDAVPLLKRFLIAQAQQA